MKKIIINAMLICTPLASQAQMLNVVCNNAEETAYKFVEKMIQLRPELTWRPVRNHFDSKIYQLSCEKGYAHGLKGDIKEMTEMYAELRLRGREAQEKGITLEYARYFLNDLSVALAYKAGYLAGVNH